MATILLFGSLTRSWKLGLIVIAPALLGLSLWRLSRPDLRPRGIYSTPHSVVALEMSPAGVLAILWNSLGDGHQCGEIRLDSNTGRILSHLEGTDRTPFWFEDRTIAYAADGTRVILPPSSGVCGDRVFGNHGDSADDSSENWLRLVSNDGHIRTLKELPRFSSLWTCTSPPIAARSSPSRKTPCGVTT